MSQHWNNLSVRTRELLRRKQPEPFSNREGLAAYNFVLPGKITRPGVTAMLRVKNEERKIVQCLTSIIGVFDEITLIDNGSTDSTVELVEQFKRDHDPEDRIWTFSYPFGIARCGKEHQNTPADSVHSLAYFYNWCLSLCRRSYVFKVDADMVLTHQGTMELPAVLRTLSPALPTAVFTPVQTIYRSPQGNWLLSRDELYSERRLFPNTSAIRYAKGKHWEMLRATIPTRIIRWPNVLFYELKDTSEDEFQHWTDRNFPTPRKKREWSNFQAVRAGAVTPDRFVEISPPF